MQILGCKLCGCDDDADYLHPLYNGMDTNYVLICEKCRFKIFETGQLFLDN